MNFSAGVLEMAGFEYDLFISYAHMDNQPFSGVEKGWVLAWHLNLGVRYVLFLRRIGINVLTAFGVEPNVHGAVVHDLDLIEVKLRMTHQIVFR
jgi:hypothetical protein